MNAKQKLTIKYAQIINNLVTDEDKYARLSKALKKKDKDVAKARLLRELEAMKVDPVIRIKLADYATDNTVHKYWKDSDEGKASELAAAPCW